MKNFHNEYLYLYLYYISLKDFIKRDDSQQSTIRYIMIFRAFKQTQQKSMEELEKIILLGMAIRMRNRINPIFQGPEYECELWNYIADSALLISMTKVTLNIFLKTKVK